MTTAEFMRQASRKPFRVRALDVEGFDPALHGTHSPPASRAGVILFWAAVAALIAARVVLFDPAATRSVGSFPGQIAPAATVR